MFLYYIRHGDPIYAPDGLTELGHKQAKALAKKLALYGLEEIYSSTPIRARQTAFRILQQIRSKLFFRHRYKFRRMEGICLSKSIANVKRFSFVQSGYFDGM